MKRTLTLLLALMLLISAALAEEAAVGMANPWTDTTAEEMVKTIGLSFDLPEGAENVYYRMIESDSLAEAQFTMDGVDYCARIKPAAEFEDISGMYYEWALEEDCEVQYCPGRVMRAIEGDLTTDVILWYDVVPGLMYSLTAQAADLDGFDIEAVAEMMFVPAQGDD